MDFTAYSAIVVGYSADVAKLSALTNLSIPLIFTKGEHAATIGKMATVGAGNYGTSTGTQCNVTNNSHPTVLTEALGVHDIYTESGNLGWLLSTALASGVGVFANIEGEPTHIGLAVLPIDGINSDGLASPEIRYFIGAQEPSKYTSHTWEHVGWIADWLVHQIALVTVVYSLEQSRVIQDMLGRGQFKLPTNLYDYLVTGTTGSAPFEAISEQEERSVMERLQWIKNALRRGTGTALPTNKSLYDVIVLDRLDHATYGLSALNTDLDTILTTLLTRVPAEVTQRAKSLYKVTEKFFADSVRITVTGTAGTQPIKSGFSISLIPANVTIDYVHIYVFSQVVENTNAASNKVNGAQNIQIQKSVGGSWTNCVSILDDALGVPATTRDMGRLIGAPVDCKSEVTGNGSYDLQWTNARVDLDSMYFDDVFFIVEIGFH